jgi:hypothetical protein
MNLVPKPSISAAAVPRASKMPPATRTGRGGTHQDLRYECHRTDLAAIAARRSISGRATHVTGLTSNPSVGATALDPDGDGGIPNDCHS